MTRKQSGVCESVGVPAWSTLSRNIQRAYQIKTRKAYRQLLFVDIFFLTFFWDFHHLKQFVFSFYMFQNPPGGRKRRPKITSPKQPLTTHIHTPNRAVRSWLKIGLQLGVVIVLGNMQEFQRFWKLDRWLTQKDLGCGVFFVLVFFFRKKRLWVYFTPCEMVMYPCD